MGGGMGFGGQPSSPPRVQQEQVMPMTQHWQQQLLRAESSRVASSPHHRARTAAMTSRMTHKPAAVAILNPNDNNRPASAQGIGSPAPGTPNGHRKNVLSVASNAPSAAPSPPVNGGKDHDTSADPMNPAQPPAPASKPDDASYEPWTGLDLGGIHLKTLSPSLFTFVHITSLYINHNNLKVLPPAISNLRNLTLLDATSNELTALPPEIGMLSKLKELLLFDNQLDSLPTEIGGLYQLEVLGIEGNPMDEFVRKTVAENGVPALIAHYRDMHQSDSPPERAWIEVEPDLELDGGSTESFTTLSYNILCPSFAPSSSYAYTPAWALEWQYRKETLLEELINASADIVCLQEIDSEQYAEWFYPKLKERGYDGAHYPRSRARTMSPDDAKLIDGCATFWKREKFHLIETQVIEFNQMALHNADVRTEDMFNRVMSRDNIATAALLEFVKTGARLVVANAHIFWDHRYRDVKLVQIGMMMERLGEIVESFGSFPAKPTVEGEPAPPKYEKKERGRDIPLVLCVDLNSLANSGVYEYISKGEVPGTHEDFMDHKYGMYTDKGLKHDLALRSSCASFGEMKMTNYTPTFDEAIDYVFYTPRSLKVTSVLGDVDRKYLSKVVGFPNAYFPSDHIPVFAQFRTKGDADKKPKTPSYLHQ
jgi:CCR4-NOT transcription complex subunit 6